MAITWSAGKQNVKRVPEIKGVLEPPLALYCMRCGFKMSLENLIDFRPPTGGSDTITVFCMYCAFEMQIQNLEGFRQPHG